MTVLYFIVFVYIVCLNETHLESNLKNHIDTLGITIAYNKEETSTKYVMEIVCNRVFAMFTKLLCLRFEQSSELYIYPVERLTFGRHLPTFYSSTLMELYANVEDFIDCLYLLDGCFSQLRTFYVSIHWFTPSSLLTINKVDQLIKK